MAPSALAWVTRGDSLAVRGGGPGIRRAWAQPQGRPGAGSPSGGRGGGGLDNRDGGRGPIEAQAARAPCLSSLPSLPSSHSRLLSQFTAEGRMAVGGPPREDRRGQE